MSSAAAADDQEYETELARDGISQDQLGPRVLLDQTHALLIGFFSGLVFSQLGTLAPETKQRQLMVICVSLTLLSLSAERIYLRTVGKWEWVAANRWAKVWMQFMRFFTVLLVFLSTNFIINTVSSSIQSTPLSWFASLAFIYVVMLSIVYFLHLMPS